MNRKGWDNLSTAYRRRLERRGITREAYTRGDSLTRARGHFISGSSIARRVARESQRRESARWNRWRHRVRRLQAGESIRKAYLIDRTIRGEDALRDTVEFYESLEAQYEDEGPDGAPYHAEWSDWYDEMGIMYADDGEWRYPELEMFYHGTTKG